MLDSTTLSTKDFDFERFFKSAEPGRGAFLSRLFGLFSEDVVRSWCRCLEAPYEDLGRPTLRKQGSSSSYSTLDFTLRERASGRTFVAEMKCELQFDGYKYLRLTAASQLDHHVKAPSNAFKWFLELAKAPDAFDVRVAGELVPVAGAILVWGAVTPEGRAAVMAGHDISAVLAVEEMVRDLRLWHPEQWIKRVRQLRLWTNQLFDFLDE